MIIYHHGDKYLEMKRSLSSGRYEFYLTREETPYKLKTITSVVEHISRNLQGIQKISTFARLFLVIALTKLALD
jgi:hypothetical protein